MCLSSFIFKPRTGNFLPPEIFVIQSYDVIDKFNAAKIFLFNFNVFDFMFFDQHTFGNVSIIICFNGDVVIIQYDVFVKFGWAVPFVCIERDIISN